MLGILHGKNSPCEPCGTFEIFEPGGPKESVWHSPHGNTYLSVGCPFHDLDGTSLVMEVHLDITDQESSKREVEATNKALLEKNKVLDKIFSHNMSSLVLLDKDYNFIKVNEVYAKACGRDVSEFPGNNHFDFYPSDAKAIFDEVVESKKAYQVYARPFIFPDDPEQKVTYWDWTLVPILDEFKEVEWLLFSLNEVTQRVKLANQKEATLEKLEAKTAEMERFVYTISHDFKSPLVTISGFMGWLKKNMDEGNHVAAIKDVATIDSAVKKMVRLQGELLNLSQIGHALNSFENVSLEYLAHEVLSQINGYEAGELDFVEIHSMPTVHCDRIKVVEVFQNLLENAVKFTQNKADPKINIGSRQLEDGTTVCFISDNGIGIEPRHQEKAFNLFEKLNTEIEGSGVGLAIAKRVVELHGGRIWVESAGNNQGATFYFTLSKMALKDECSS